MPETTKKQLIYCGVKRRAKRLNKRHKKKREKEIVRERQEFLELLNIRTNLYVRSRQNGKIFLIRKMVHTVYSKRYKPIKELKRYLNKIYISRLQQRKGVHSYNTRP